MEIQDISINFLPLTVQEFSFVIYRKPRGQNEKKPSEDLLGAWLPQSSIQKTNDLQNKSPFWISFEKRTNFEEYTCQEDFDWTLTKRYLHHLLLANASRVSQHKAEDKFRRYITFVIKKHPEGNETIWLEPYYLQEKNLFGFLIDFKFKMFESVPFSKKIQMLSLSLDKHFRSNKNFYSDKFGRIKYFIRNIIPELFPIITNTNKEISIDTEFSSLRSKRLRTKEYIFNNHQTSKSQFKGVKDFGPLEKLDSKVSFYFLCRPQDTEYANQLYKALRGDTFSNSFSGMERFFRIQTTKPAVKGKTISIDKEADFDEAISEIKSMTGIVIPILILPSKYNEQNPISYYLAKYKFAKENIPIQVVTMDLLSNEVSLKWSIANIGLQIFAKLGGQPWIVKPENSDCLIIGIGQAHKKIKEAEENYKIAKYFAYSVLTDSSGKYIDLQVLAENLNQEGYLSGLKKNIKRIIDKYGHQFKKIAIHSTFKIERDETQSILATIKSSSEEYQNVEFVVIKINADNKFFGFDLGINSLVPFESTYIQIAPKEYLVWFEGLQYHNPKVQKRYSGPTHIEFLLAPENKEKDISYLQDVINLSGANWRGFNAKALPVSIHYCRLVAKFISEFDNRGYKDYRIDNLKPWFL